MPVITLTTDFGTRDPFVGIMKGVLAGRAPAATVIDVTHALPPQDVLAGALVLRHAVPWFPAGTVHVAVVDPGVGSARRALCLETDGGHLVGPDNGVLSLAADTLGLRRIVHVTERRFFLTPTSATFHGRDVFAPVAAALASGTPATALGPESADLVRVSVPEPVREERRVRGEVVYVDHFGNLITNIPAAAVEDGSWIRIRDLALRGPAASYAAVEPGEAVAVIGSWGLLEVAVRDRNAHKLMGVDVGQPVIVEAL